jgi:hypothetical protein
MASTRSIGDGGRSRSARFRAGNSTFSADVAEMA